MKKLSEEEALERVLKIDWYSDFTHHESNVKLAKEYLRRMLQWHDTLVPATLPEKPYIQWWVFFDVAALIDPSIRASTEVMNQLNELRVDRWAKRLCEWYLHWTALANVVDVGHYKLEAPYEPAIHIFEQGSEIAYRESYFDICGTYLKIRDFDAFKKSEPFVTLDNENDLDN